MCVKRIYCSVRRNSHRRTAYRIELHNAAVQEDAQEVSTGLGAAGTR